VVAGSRSRERLLASRLRGAHGGGEFRRGSGRLLGRGIVCCVESSGFGKKEPARARIEKDGTLRLFVGSTPGGQGHSTVAAQVVAERMGFSPSRVNDLETAVSEACLNAIEHAHRQRAGVKLQVSVRAGADDVGIADCGQ